MNHTNRRGSSIQGFILDVKAKIPLGWYRKKVGLGTIGGGGGRVVKPAPLPSNEQEGDSPIMLSFPHFYLADDSLRLAVEGISPPNPEEHRLYIDVQPVRVQEWDRSHTKSILERLPAGSSLPC
ncbi:Lysosome membrane protein 2 [Eumeta japonica]|uniref:Lysosome membrane protein 2 n=1 Tax=Eumeta variegata TaxID=151549 RepID=A0A4C1YK99_EUMVA|nr:Lysosome membrane protein 2 [Eumeta japonica]